MGTIIGVDPLLIGVLTAVAVIAVTALAPKTGVAAPLILVALGVGISALPGVPAIELPPEIILAGVLPPLLYSAATNLPTMDFRRDFAAIGGLSILLVIITSVVLGVVFNALIPELGLAGGIALGSIVSPTDAVATSITKRLGAPPRVVTVLEGEGLLNDASALVILRSAVAATAASVSFGWIALEFAWAVVGATVIGIVVGILALKARRRVSTTALSTAISFVVPFAAYLPAEHAGASGLVAVVAAGLVTGVGKAKYLEPNDRISESSNWHTIELLLEGAVFLLLGLEVAGMIDDVFTSHRSMLHGMGMAALAGVVVLAVRLAYVAPLLLRLRKRARQAAGRRDTLDGATRHLDAKIAAAEPGGQITINTHTQAIMRVPTGPHLRAGSVIHPHPLTGKKGGRTGADGEGDTTCDIPVERVERLRFSLARRVADIDYLVEKPLGPRDGTLLVWAGMRGVVTVAAAQSLPRAFPMRSFVVLIAFGVALGTLIIQGGTLPLVVRWLRLDGQGTLDMSKAWSLRRVLDDAANDVLDDARLAQASGAPFDPDMIRRVRAHVVREQVDEDADARESSARTDQYRELRLRVVEAQRKRLLEMRRSGTFDSNLLQRALRLMDAEQIAVEMRRT